MTQICKDENNVPKPVDLGTILIQDVGRLSPYQVRILVLCAVAAALQSCTSEYIFTTGRIATRCLISECENATDPPEFKPNWLSNAVPKTETGFDNCYRFANINNKGTADDDHCPPNLFNPNVTVECEKYVYEKDNTVVYDLGLACKEWQRSWIGSVRTMGALVSLPIAGVISDHWGRRNALAIFSFNAAWLGLTRYWAYNYNGFLVSVFAESVLGSGAIHAPTFWVYSYVGVESVSTQYRTAAGIFLNTFDSTGQVMLGLLAWAFPYWRHLTLVIYAPLLLTLSYFWILPESVRWYLSKGRYHEAKTALKQMAKSNGKELSEKSLLELTYSAEQENIRVLETNNQNEPWLVVLLLEHKPILLRCLLAPIWWMCSVLIYYGLAVNAVNISGNPYLNFMVVSLVDIPAFWTAFLLMNKVGRKPVLIGFYWMCAMCQLAYIFIPRGLYKVSLPVYLVGKFSISAAGTTLYVYTLELFPTKYRQTLFGYCSMMGRIGSIIAPFIPALGSMVWQQLPFVLFMGLALLTRVLVMMTPETSHCRLPDTMQEAGDAGRSQTCTRPA